MFVAVMSMFKFTHCGKLNTNRSRLNLFGFNKCRIFDSANNNLGDPKIPGSEFKNKPEGWETTSKNPDGNIWDMSQREEDILVQEFERRIAFNKFQVRILQH